MSPKIVQIAIAVAFDNGDEIRSIVAVDDDGRAWSFSKAENRWKKFPPLPEVEPKKV